MRSYPALLCEPDLKPVAAALIGAAVALTVSCLLTGGLAAAGPVDDPKARGLHHRPTPTSGGLAIAAGAGLGAALFAAFAVSPHGPAIAACLGLAGALGALGAADDLLDLNARLKLALQSVLALGFCALFARVETLPLPFGDLALGPVIGTLGSALWIVVVINGVNFMDGANGLAPGAMVVALTVEAVALHQGGQAGLAGLALIGAAAGLGFLPWNLPGGRLFQGDAGSLFSSALFAALALVGAGPAGDGAISLWFGPLALAPLLTDVFLTLLDRARRGEPLLKAHRDHLFQRWLAVGPRSHGALAVRIWGLTVLSGVGALALAYAPPGGRSLGLVAGLGVCVWLWRRIDRSLLKPSG